LEKSASFFHLPIEGMELGFLDSRWRGGSRRRWRSGWEYKKIDQKGKADKKGP
jgi:hypothetical protein